MTLPFPIRLGATSFVYPGGWLANVERLAPRFSDIEILFFEAGGAHCLPGGEECEGLARCKKARAGLTYSLHTPLEVSLGSEDEARRLASVAAVERAIEAARPFAPETYVVHAYLGDREHDDRLPRDLAAWRRRVARSFTQLIDAGVAPRDLCVEVLDYDFAVIEPVVVELGLSVALDVGHLVRDGRDEDALLRRHLPRTRLIQWHGTDPSGRDHRSLIHYPRERAARLLARLRDAAYPGVLTIEVFREGDLEESMALLDDLLAEVQA